MNGIDRDGQAVGLSRRTGKSHRPGPLSSVEVADVQSILARGLLAQGYSRGQVAQILNRSPRTVFNRLKSAAVPAASLRPC